MKLSTISLVLASAGGITAMPSQNQREALSTALGNIKRDPTGAGFTHLGSDNVLRSFDARMNVVDHLALDARAAPRAPSAAVLEEVRTARARSLEQVSKPRGVGSALENRGAESCVSVNCPSDSYCRGMSVNGYNCSSCLLVSSSIGNCQT